MSYTPKNPNGSATSANSSPVVIASDQSTVPVSVSGVATAANQSTIIGHVDGIETLLTTIDADTSALAGAVAGTEVQVDVVGALPAGTNNIGDVDVLSMPATGVEDAPETAGGTLLMAGSVRRDTAASSAGTTGDNATINTDSVGALWTRDTVTTADDAAFTLGTSRAVPNGAVAVTMDGTDPLAVSAEGDVAALRSDPNRILLVNQTHPRYFRASADYASAQTNASVVAAPGAGLSLWITDIVISNGATAGNITLLDGSGGSVVFEIYPAVNGGVAHSFRNPIKLTANTALVITSTTVTTHAVNVTGYIAA